MAEESKWNWKEICSIKEEIPEWGSTAVQENKAEKVRKVTKSKPQNQTLKRSIKLTAEQKRAASHAKYGIAPPRKELVDENSDQTLKDFISESVVKVGKDPRMTQEKFKIYKSNRPKSSRTTNPDTTESFSGLQIKDRIISAEEMTMQMEGRKFYKLADLEKASMQDLQNQEIDWVTIAVLTKKTLARAENSPFVVWTLSDLDNAMISVFLYQNAYEEHWKELEGSIVALINPSVMQAKENGKFALKATLGFHIVKLGSSIHFGLCKSLTLSGAQCKIPINTSNGDYCVIHMAAKFKDAGKGRQELNSANTFRSDLFRNGDGVRNISAGSYGTITRNVTSPDHNVVQNTKGKEQAKRKRSDVYMGISTKVSAVGEVVVPKKQDIKSTSAVATTPFVQKNPSEAMAELRQSITNAKGKQNPTTQTMVAKLLGIGPKSKKVNLMQVMRITAENTSTVSTTPSSGSLMSSLVKPATKTVAEKPFTSSVNPMARLLKATSAGPRVPRTELTDRARQVTSLRATGFLD